MASQPSKESPVDATRHCLTEIPYRMVVYVRSNRQTPLFCVVGSTKGASSAENALREAFRIHGGICFYCKKKVRPDQLSIDHVEPLVAGGNKDLQNLVISHRKCNLAKGHKPIECYKSEAGREWLSALLAQVQDRLNRL